MRAFACFTVFAFLGLVGACAVPPGTTSAATTAGTGATTSSSCNQGDGCSSCVSCAEEGPCATAYTTCDQDPDCQEVYACAAGCDTGDTSCIEACEEGDSAGATNYEALITCIYCDQCSSACAGQCTMTAG